MQSRRSFLKVGLGGAALLGLSGIGIALQKSRPLPVRAGRTLTFFSATEYAIVAAVAERILARDVPSGLDPATAGGAIPLVPAVLAAEWAARPQPPAVADVDVAGKMDAFLTPLDPASKKEFKQLVHLFENALFSLVSGMPPIPFTQKSAEQQDQHLAAWANSRLAVKRTGYQVLKRLSCAMYFASPETYASVGYPGPPVELVKSVLEARKAAATPPAMPPAPPTSPGAPAAGGAR